MTDEKPEWKWQDRVKGRKVPDEKKPLPKAVGHKGKFPKEE